MRKCGFARLAPGPHRCGLASAVVACALTGGTALAGIPSVVFDYPVDAVNGSAADYNPGWVVRQSPLPMLAPVGVSVPAADPTNERARFAENNFGSSNAAAQTFTAPSNFDLRTLQVAATGDTNLVYGVSIHAVTTLLGYRTPAEFDVSLAGPPVGAAPQGDRKLS